MVATDSIRNCGICCGGFSLFAIFFLLSVGGIIDSGSEIIDVAESKRSSAASTCYYGALIYFITFLLSLACFFGPLFLKRSGSSDLEALRNGAGNRRPGSVVVSGREFNRL